jgi:peptidoglycan/LPS O-acetylase OafA/YrhL
MKDTDAASRQETQRLDYIDAMRGLAILAVLVMHSAVMVQTDIPIKSIQNIINSGAMGVQLFYITSAFTLFLSLKSKSDKEHNPTRNFFLRRFFRIAPLYYIMIVYHLIESNFHVSPGTIISHFVFLHGLHPYWINSVVGGAWSIADEALFYLMTPFLFFHIKNIKRACNILLASLVLRVVLYEILSRFNPVDPNASFFTSWWTFLYCYLPNQLPVFLLGVVLYFLIVEKQSLPVYPLVHSGKFIVTVSVLILGELASKKNILTRFILNVSVFDNHILFAAAFSLFIIGISKFKFKLFVNPLVGYIGKISYSMYLTHFLIVKWMTKANFLDFIENDLGNYFIRFMVITVITMAFSTITYYVIERPFQNCGKKIIAMLEKKV